MDFDDIGFFFFFRKFEIVNILFPTNCYEQALKDLMCLLINQIEKLSLFKRMSFQIHGCF